jgi:uncharacterized protein (UPF0335 family)
MKCPRCGKDNPAEVHTCAPLALKLATELMAGDVLQAAAPAAAELRKQYEEIVRLESEVEGTAQRNRDIYGQLDKAEAEIDRLYADNEALREALRVLVIERDGHYSTAAAWDAARAALTGEKT